MCGIWARIQRLISGGPVCDCEDFDVDLEIRNRGPDSYDIKEIDDVKMIGAVLSLRGGHLVRQPISRGNLHLLWNGELYGNNVYSDEEYDLERNDTEQMIEKLEKASPLQVFSEIEGCFAFVLLKDNEVWFGRDFLGRRSLVVNRNHHGYTISSLGPGLQVPTGGIFKVSLLSNSCEFIAWPHLGLVTPSTLRFTLTSHPQDYSEALNNSVRLRLIGSGEIGILFSGGLDCTVLAALSHRYLPSLHKIFLLNVAFLNDAPDRITGISSYLGLKQAFPSRNFVMVLINITEEEIERNKSRIIELIGKNDSRMDFSIATALFFASRGEGVCSETQEKISFPGKILLSGMGADEIFGGYSRYRSSYIYYNDAGVIREMSLDIDRLWHRNLGRDDRVTACHGKELRFPYLDSHLWQALSALKLEQVTQPQYPGKDKMLLREYAKSIGLGFVSDFKKRAIQFGTRISQICNVKDFGSNRKAKGWQSLNGDKTGQIDKEIEWCCQELQKKITHENNEEIAKTIRELQNPSVNLKRKRHLMRVHLGDYISLLEKIAED